MILGLRGLFCEVILVVSWFCGLVLLVSCWVLRLVVWVFRNLLFLRGLFNLGLLFGAWCCEWFIAICGFGIYLV